jgi:hypothetical protein
MFSLSKLTDRRKRSNLGFMGESLSQHCYLCDIALKKYRLKPGDKRPPDDLDPDHVPPKGLFPKPRPDNLITVPCCFACNNQHSGFDERLRIAASLPFDRNAVGQSIWEDKVVGGTLAEGRQTEFAKKLFASMRTVSGRPELLHVQIGFQEFKEGMIRIAKGLLFTLHPNCDYRESAFRAMEVSPQASDEQLKVMAMLLKQGQYFERGQRVFQCWRHVDEKRGGGVWMMCFYECFGFFVLHGRRGPEVDRFPS